MVFVVFNIFPSRYIPSRPGLPRYRSFTIRHTHTQANQTHHTHGWTPLGE